MATNLNVDQDDVNLFQPDIVIPELAENRVPTDRKFITVFKVMLPCLVPFIIYTLCYADMDRYSVDVDPEIGKVEDFLHNVAGRLTIACFFSLGAALVILHFFRVATALMIKGILAGPVIVLSFLTVISWFADFGSTASVVLTVLLLILVGVLAFFYKKLNLLIAIFEEAVKVTFDIPRIFLVPLLIFLIDSVVSIIFFTLLAYMITAGIEVINGTAKYDPNIVMRFTIFMTVWMTFWVNQFFTGIHYMVVAGVVSKWYFAKVKCNLESSVLDSASITYKFHLGSAAFGALILTLVAIVRSLLSSLCKNRILKTCFNCFMGPIEELLRILSKNAYALTAMHGKPFIKSGKMAMKIFRQEVTNVAVLNLVGRFIIAMACFLVVLISWLFTYLIMLGENSRWGWSAYVVVFIVSLIVAAYCFCIFEPIIDTIYLCFCEDKLINDGLNRPFAMSKELMQFMEDSKKVFGEKKAEGERQGYIDL